MHLENPSSCQWGGSVSNPFEHKLLDDVDGIRGQDLVCVVLLSSSEKINNNNQKKKNPPHHQQQEE